MVKGSKGSKKSYTTALWYVYHLTKYRDANLLVIKKVGNTIRDTVFATIEWALHRLGVASLWSCSESRLRMRNKITGQVILFRGMDEPLKLASVTVTHGYLCWVWFEEFYDISSEAAFNTVAMSIRAVPPESGLWKQYTGTFNPWSQTSWIKSRFFDHPDPDVLAITTTYKCNEHLTPDDIKMYEELYERSPRQARIICDGDWGIAEGLVYENWTEEMFDIKEIIEQPGIQVVYGLDFGFSISYNAFVAVAIDVNRRELWVFDEMYERGMTNLQLAKRICNMGYGKEVIWADSASPLNISELSQGLVEEVVDENGNVSVVRWALPNIRPVVKGPDSLQNGIQRLQTFKMHIHSTCTNTIIELQNYCYDKNKEGEFIDRPIKEFDHCLVAGTMVETDHGAMPIENVRPGDMVLTHLGYRKVLAAGITRPEPVEIWRATFEDGTILEGTDDHKIMTTQGYKKLGCLTIRDKVVQYLGNLPNTSTVSVSNTMGDTGTEAPMQKQGTSACIIEAPIAKHQCCYTDTSGRNTTALSPRDATSITSTAIPITTTSPTSNASLVPSMYGNTLGLKSTENLSVNSCPISNLHRNVHAENGMLLKKVTNGMFNTERGSQKISSPSNKPVNTAVRSTWQSPLVESSVQMPANQQPVEPPESITRIAFVQYVAEHSASTNTKKQEPVPQNAVQYPDLRSIAEKCRLLSVAKVEKTGRYEYVYDLTVDEAHDFFADCILVSNCADAIRYACSSLYVDGSSYVFEAKGRDDREIGHPKNPVSIGASPWVYSSKRQIPERALWK